MNTAPLYSSADYLVALQNLLPRGRIWPRDADAVMTAALAGLAPIYVRNNARANQVIDEAFPPATYELLPQWEATLGLPDPCGGVAPTVQARRGQVVARFIAKGGQSAAYFIEFAAALGFTITVNSCAPFRMGQSRMGQPLGDSEWMFVWQVHGPVDAAIPFRMGLSAMGEPLEAFVTGVLQCELNAITPAHTLLQYLS